MGFIASKMKSKQIENGTNVWNTVYVFEMLKEFHSLTRGHATQASIIPLSMPVIWSLM